MHLICTKLLVAYTVRTDEALMGGNANDRENLKPRIWKCSAI